MGVVMTMAPTIMIPIPIMILVTIRIISAFRIAPDS
jgi:hypothetical protein